MQGVLHESGLSWRVYQKLYTYRQTSLRIVGSIVISVSVLTMEAAMHKSTYIRQYYPAGLFAALVITAAIAGYIPSLQINVQRNLIDTAIDGMAGGSFHSFLVHLLQFLALILSSQLLTSLLQFGTTRLNLIVKKKLDARRVEKCCKVSFPITETQVFHELCEKAEKAAESDQAFFSALQTGVKSAVQILTSFLVLFSIDARTAMVVFVLLFLGIWVNKAAARDSGNFWGEYIQNMRHANYLSSLLLHREYAMERKVFHYNPEIERRYHKDCFDAMAKNSKLGRKRLISESVTTLFAAIYSMTAILLLAAPVGSGSISIGAFIATFTAIGSLRNVASQLYGAVFDVSNHFSRLSGFFSLLELEEDRTPKSAEPIDLSKGIAFQHVSFSYPGTSAAVLEDISFTLKPGIHYALVGENGCGKTTLVKLLIGLYQPTSGQIYVGGKDVSKLCSEEKRQIFSAIFQDFYRYPLSIRENVCLSSSTPQSTDAIHAVLESLQFDAPLRKKEHGLDIGLGFLKQESTDLSGGEWQKLTIARSVLSPAQIIVLDEPNAALDPMSELAFYQAYEEMFDSKTTLFISHRLGAVKSADQILVLHNRHLIAMDAHNALMNTCEYYRELFETQRGLYYGTQS